MHFTEYVEEIKILVRNYEFEKAEKLLLHCCQLTEEESLQKGWGVAPWYYEKLAIIYSKQKRIEDEIFILKRYNNQKKALGVKPKKLKKRLDNLLKRIT